MTDGSRRAIVAAFLANLGIAVAKLVAFFFTGAASMLAESVHSLADTGNQALLLLGAKRSRQAPTAEHPDSGLLTFVDPRRGACPVVGLDLFPTTYSVAPATSRLVIFPGYLQHYVHAYCGERPRICIAANASIRVTGPPRAA